MAGVTHLIWARSTTTATSSPPQAPSAATSVLLLLLLLTVHAAPSDAGRTSTNGFFHKVPGLVVHRLSDELDGSSQQRRPPATPSDATDAAPLYRASNNYDKANKNYNETTCDLCADNWLFVLAAGGRTGSTTAMSMFNSVPGFEIGGEHLAVLDAEQSYLGHVTQTEGGANNSEKGLAFQHRPHDLHALRCSVQDRMKRLVFGTDYERLSREVRVLGFKEIRYLTIRSMAFIASVFPCARYVFTYRNQTDAEVRAVNFRNADLPHLWHDAGLLYRHLAEEFPQQMGTLAVESLNTQRYNDILHGLLGVRGCSFSKIFHENAGGGYTATDSHPVKRAGVLMDGDCDLSDVNFSLPSDVQQRDSERWKELVRASKAAQSNNNKQNNNTTTEANSLHSGRQK